MTIPLFPHARPSPLLAVSPRRGQRGVTLLELSVVMMILSVLVAIAGIPVSAGEGSALELAEIQLRDAFATAQNLSYSLGVPHGVVFDPANDRMAVVADDGTPARDPLTHGAYVVDFAGTGQPKGLDIVSASFGTTGAAGIFDALGAPVTGGQVTVAMGNAARTFGIDAATGEMSVIADG